MNALAQAPVVTPAPNMLSLYDELEALTASRDHFRTLYRESNERAFNATMLAARNRRKADEADAILDSVLSALARTEIETPTGDRAAFIDDLLSKTHSDIRDCITAESLPARRIVAAMIDEALKSETQRIEIATASLSAIKVESAVLSSALKNMSSRKETLVFVLRFIEKKTKAESAAAQ